ncbi:MAG: hypothetical protein L3J57_13750, partial [Desulfuromusa sp.]|nr:hypothetical protein [Desulfuromusa sp.]
MDSVIIPSMFIRVKNKPTKANVFNKTVQLVESYREQGKVKQRIIKHLGVAYDPQQLDDLKALAQILKEKLEDSPQLTLFNAD